MITTMLKSNLSPARYSLTSMSSGLDVVPPHAFEYQQMVDAILVKITFFMASRG